MEILRQATEQFPEITLGCRDSATFARRWVSASQSLVSTVTNKWSLNSDKWGCPDGYFMIHTKCVKVSDETAGAMEAEMKCIAEGSSLFKSEDLHEVIKPTWGLSVTRLTDLSIS